MAIHTIDGSNPITSGLVLAIYDGQEVVNSGAMTQINASNSAFVGTAFVSNSTTDGGASVDISSIKASLEGQPNVTIFSRSAIDSYDAFGTITQIPWSLTAWADPYQSLGLVRNNVADSAILHFTIAGNVQTAVSAAGFFQADGTTHDYAATKNNTTDVEFYKDGSAHSTGTNANAGQNIQLNTSKAFVFSRNDTASAEGTDGTNEITLYWNRELSAAEHASISTDPFQVFATTSRSITNIDGDNNVQAGQTNITVTTVGMDSAPTVKTATLGGESFTVVSAGETSWVVSAPLHIDLEWGATHDYTQTDDTGPVTLAGVTLSAPTGWETVAFTTAPNPATTESFYEYAQTDTGLGGAGYTMLAGDILAWETQTGLTIDGQTIPQVDPPSTVSGSYKIWKDSAQSWTSVSTFTVNDLGFPTVEVDVNLGAITESSTVNTIAPQLGVFAHLENLYANPDTPNSIQPITPLNPGVYPVTITATRESDGLVTTRQATITVLGAGVTVLLGSITESSTVNPITSATAVIVALGSVSETSAANEITAQVESAGIDVILEAITESGAVNAIAVDVAGGIGVSLGTISETSGANAITALLEGDIDVILASISEAGSVNAIRASIADDGWEIELQRALYSALSLNPAVTSIVNDVYDSVPQNTEFPYITIGEAVHNEFDTDTELGHDATITIHVWSRHRGRSEAKQIQSAIYKALHRANLPIVGYNLITCDFTSSQTFDDSDGKTRHGVQEFRVLMAEY